MDIQKLELLLRKINQAINTIKQLKEKEAQNNDMIKLLSEENSLLKEENERLKKEVQNNNQIHTELEDKIAEILKYLPDEDENVEDAVEEKSVSDNDVYDIKDGNRISFDDIEDEENTEEAGSEAVETVSDEEKKEEPVEGDAAESEEQMLKKFVKEELNAQDNFPMDAKNFPEINMQENSSEVNPQDEDDAPSFADQKTDEEINQDLFDINTDDIEFNFEDRQNDDLPKGVL